MSYAPRFHQADALALCVHCGVEGQWDGACPSCGLLPSACPLEEQRLATKAECAVKAAHRAVAEFESELGRIKPSFDHLITVEGEDGNWAIVLAEEWIIDTYDAKEDAEDLAAHVRQDMDRVASQPQQAEGGPRIDGEGSKP